jgi:hypothetical protein
MKWADIADSEEDKNPVIEMKWEDIADSEAEMLSALGSIKKRENQRYFQQ